MREPSPVEARRQSSALAEVHRAFRRLDRSRPLTTSWKHPCGEPIRASGISHAMPRVTPAPDEGPQPNVTPAMFRLSIVTLTPNGFVPPKSVPGPPAVAAPSSVNVPPLGV